MILVDTGPLVAMFDRQDSRHASCVATLKTFREPLRTTIPVLTEAFHVLTPQGREADALRDFIARDGLAVWFLDRDSVTRAFELMERYADHPMDLADASLVVAAESLETRMVFTIDRTDFSTYRIRRGHRHYAFEVLA